MPFLVRKDTNKFLRETDMLGGEASRDNLFYVYDDATAAAVPAPGTGGPPPPPGSMEPVHPHGTLELGELKPALEGEWEVQTKDGPVTVTTVYAKMLASVQEYAPDKATTVTGVTPELIRQTARTFAKAETAMIFSGYRVCKWLHGDLIQRAFMLLLSVTGNLGKPGTGLQIWNVPKEEDQFAFMFADLPPTLRIATMARWDYAKANLKEFNAEIYGEKLSAEVDKSYQEAIANRWYPDFSKTPWKMGIYSGSNAANWRSSGKRWREEAFGKLETMLVATPDMGVTAMYADYVLPVAHHYERKDFMLEPRTPYAQVLDEAVPPLGEAKDDYAVYVEIAKAISRRATERGIAPVDDNFMGIMPVSRDLTKFYDMLTMNGTIMTNEDVINFLLRINEAIPVDNFKDMARQGIVRNNDTDGVMYGENSPYGAVMKLAVERKQPYPTLTGRQQFYMDHDWFLQENEELPVYRAPVAVPDHPLRMLMGHARHGIHSMWRDDSLLLSLQRGEPDIYVNPDDAAARGVSDGDLIRVFNTAGYFIAMAHVTSSMQPGMTYMYHGWDPMMFRDQQNFGAVVSSAGLIKRTSLVSGYGHVTYRPLSFEPNAVFNDFTCNFEKYVEAGAA
jgi:anaerobic selenocysteine-containing dehydrogenase